MLNTDDDLDELLLDLLHSEGKLTLPARGFSMRRHDRWADTLVLYPVDVNRLRIGSVLVFRRHGIWVAHRVIWVFPKDDPRLCVTKGDAFMAFDRPAVMKGDEVAVVGAIATGDRVQSLTATRWIRTREKYRGLVGLADGTLWGLLRFIFPWSKDDSGTPQQRPPQA
jgi:hypothetical protein